jgi:excisionase family DNA binding protein
MTFDPHPEHLAKDEYTISVKEAAKRYFGLSQNAGYRMVERGELPAIRIGRLIRVPVAAVEQMLLENPALAPDREVLRTGFRFTPEDDAIIAADYKAYVPTTETAEKLGRSDGVIRQRILRLGLRRSNNASRMLEWAPEHLAKELKSGQLEGAEFVRLCHEWRDNETERLKQQQSERAQQIQADMLKQSAEIDARADLTRKEKIRAKRMIGLTLQEVADQYGLTRERIRQITDPRAGEMTKEIFIYRRTARRRLSPLR